MQKDETNETSTNEEPEVGAYYDPEVDGDYTPNGGDK